MAEEVVAGTEPTESLDDAHAALLGCPVKRCSSETVLEVAGNAPSKQDGNTGRVVLGSSAVDQRPLFFSLIDFVVVVCIFRPGCEDLRFEPTVVYYASLEIVNADGCARCLRA